MLLLYDSTEIGGTDNKIEGQSLPLRIYNPVESDFYERDTRIEYCLNYKSCGCNRYHVLSFTKHPLNCSL